MVILKNRYLYLFLIILVGFYLRLYMIDRPIADWHSWRQADTAAVARNFYKQTVAYPEVERREDLTPSYIWNMFIRPQGDDMTPQGTELVNVNRYRFVEFPIYGILVYLTYLINGGVEVYLARLVSVFFSLGSIVFIFLIVKRYWSLYQAYLAALLFAILPFNVYFSRTTLPEPTLIFFCLGMFYFTDRWIFENKIWLFVLSSFFAMSAFLIKPMAIFYLLPLIYSYFVKEGRFIPPFRYWIWIFLALAPLGLWRWWMSAYPEGIPASDWLSNGNGIRFRPAFFRWIINDRLGREILSVTGTALLVLGLVVRPKGKEGWLLHLLALSLFSYIAVFATGNVMHDYYQVIVIPALVIFVGRAVAVLTSGSPFLLPRIISIPIAVFLLAICLGLSFYEVRGFYQINNDAVVKAGEFTEKVLPKDAIVVAPNGGDTSLLYQINRSGFAIMITSPEKLVEKYGVDYYISVDVHGEDTKNILKKYKALEKNEEFVVVDLNSPIKEVEN